MKIYKRNKFKIGYYFSLLLLLISCKNSNINRYQYKTTLENIECYKGIINTIQSSPVHQNQFKEIKASRLRGERDPITISQDYRLLNTSEINTIIESILSKECINSIRTNSDLLGLRYVTNELMIIEIDRFPFRSAGSSYSSINQTEFHRIIYCNTKPNLSDYSFGGEYEVLFEEISKNLFYQISKIDSMHGGRF